MDVSLHTFNSFIQTVTVMSEKNDESLVYCLLFIRRKLQCISVCVMKGTPPPPSKLKFGFQRDEFCVTL